MAVYGILFEKEEHFCVNLYVKITNKNIENANLLIKKEKFNYLKRIKCAFGENKNTQKGICLFFDMKS